MNNFSKTFLVAAMIGSVTSAQAVINFEADAIAWTDISTTGTALTSTDDAEITITGATLTTAGFTGNDLLAGNRSIRVGNNGGIIWGNSATDTFTGATEIGWANSTTFLTMAASNTATLGNGGGVRQFLAVHWDDTVPVTGTGANSIRWQVISGDLIVQWFNQDHFNAPGTGTIAFQTVIRSGINHKRVSYVYNDTLFSAGAFQNDGGSATIGFKNNGLNAFGNDIEFGVGGGAGSAADTLLSSRPKVSGWVENSNPNLTKSVSIVPEPASMIALGMGALALLRRRKTA